MKHPVEEKQPRPAPAWVPARFRSWRCGIVFLVSALGCAHYPVNQPLRHYDPQAGYRASNLSAVENNDQLLLLTFSGGGTRAAAFSYGVLETLRDTPVSVQGRQQRLLDEVDWISGKIILIFAHLPRVIDLSQTLNNNLVVR
jgi:hypothetical protein